MVLFESPDNFIRKFLHFFQNLKFQCYINKIIQKPLSKNYKVKFSHNKTQNIRHCVFSMQRFHSIVITEFFE